MRSTRCARSILFWTHPMKNLLATNSVQSLPQTRTESPIGTALRAKAGRMATTFSNLFSRPSSKSVSVEPRLIPNLTSYREGKFADAAKKACDNPDAIREIIERVSGRELPADWFPWQPIDSKGSLDGHNDHWIRISDGHVDGPTRFNGTIRHYQG